MRFEMRGVDHDPLGSWPFSRERGEDAIEDVEPAPVDEAIVKRLGRSILTRRVFPLQAMLDDIPLTTRRSSTRGTPWDKGK